MSDLVLLCWLGEWYVYCYSDENAAIPIDAGREAIAETVDDCTVYIPPFEQQMGESPAQDALKTTRKFQNLISFAEQRIIGLSDA